MLLDVIVITAPIWAHKKISKYFYGGDEEHNLQYWKRHFLDDEMEVTWHVMDKSAGVAFIEVETDGTAPPVAIIKTLVDKLVEAVKFVLNKHDIPVDIMYRHSGMRYEMSFIEGDLYSFNEYLERACCPFNPC